MIVTLPLSHLQQVLLLLGIVILASKVAGAVSKRFGQPAVLGELLVGLLLGPTLLNLMHWPVFTEHELLNGLVKYIAELGVIFLMFLAGLETNLTEMKRVGLAAFAGATGGVLLPLIGGTLVARYIGNYEWFPSIFIGTVLTATSVSISAQTLLELGHLRSKEGTTILGAAVVDDIMGIIVLSIVIAAHAAGGGGSAPLWLVCVQMVVYFAAAIALGRWAVPGLLRWAERWPGSETGLAVAIVLCLFYAFSAEAFGKVAAITGAYTLGVMMSQHHDLGHRAAEKVSVMAYGFFVPVFFVSIGLEADAMGALRANPWLAVLIVLVSIVSKIVGSGLGVRLVGFDLGQSLRVGIGMISRGEVALIVSNIGLAAGVINTEVFSLMVLMTLVTTLVTPLLLRMVFKEAAQAES